MFKKGICSCFNLKIICFIFSLEAKEICSSSYFVKPKLYVCLCVAQLRVGEKCNCAWLFLMNYSIKYLVLCLYTWNTNMIAILCGILLCYENAVFDFLVSPFKVSNLASEAKRERHDLNKEVTKISNYGISVWNSSVCTIPIRWSSAVISA